MKETIIKLDEQTLYQKIRERVHKIITERYDGWDGYDEPDMPQNASDDFYNSGFEATLKEKYPNMNLECDVENDGTVTVTDLDSEKYYTGQGEVEYEVMGLGYPSKYDYDSEAEGEVPYFDFTRCLKEIMTKIDNNKPDGSWGSEEIIETTPEEITKTVQEALKFFQQS